jgi:hypothetical protein
MNDPSEVSESQGNPAVVAPVPIGTGKATSVKRSVPFSVNREGSGGGGSDKGSSSSTTTSGGSQEAATAAASPFLSLDSMEDPSQQKQPGTIPHYQNQHAGDSGSTAGTSLSTTTSSSTPSISQQQLQLLQQIGLQVPSSGNSLQSEQQQQQLLNLVLQTAAAQQAQQQQQKNTNLATASQEQAPQYRPMMAPAQIQMNVAQLLAGSTAFSSLLANAQQRGQQQSFGLQRGVHATATAPSTDNFAGMPVDGTQVPCKSRGMARDHNSKVSLS